MNLINNDFSYTWFFYLGIILFFSHIAIYGLGLHISYFSLILIYIGYRRPFLSNWVINVLWFFIALDIYSNITTARNKIIKYLYDDSIETEVVKFKEGATNKKTNSKTKSKTESKTKSKTNSKTKSKTKSKTESKN